MDEVEKIIRYIRNYRPVALLPVPAELFETIILIHTNLYSHVRHKLSPPPNFGESRVVQVNLLNFTHFILTVFDKEGGGAS